MSTSKALEKLGFDPDNDFELVDDRDGRGVRLIWKSDQAEPTQQEIDNAENEWQAEQDATEYQRLRAPEYPPIGDQLDALLKHLNYRRTQGDELIQELDDIIGDWLNVKSKYPKE